MFGLFSEFFTVGNKAILIKDMAFCYVETISMFSTHMLLPRNYIPSVKP